MAGCPYTVLVVTHRLAQEVDGVIDLLRDFGLHVARWNLCEYPERSVATATRDRITTDRIVFDGLSCPRVAWIHDTGSFSVASSLRGLEREVAIRECQAFRDGVLAALRCNWLNEPSKIRTASSKILQLITAERLGIPIPSYCITNDPTEAVAFSQSKNAVVVKAVRGGFLLNSDSGIKFFTRRLADVKSDIFDNLRYGPIIFQEEIDRRAELRVTVVDDDCFVMEIDCANLPDNCVDVRQLNFPTNVTRFRRGVGQHDVERWSRALLQELQLVYGAFDWAISSTGQAYFLECNPLGAFKWTEFCTSFDITGSIARALYRRANVT